jgi:hypothetical protein
MAMITEGKGSSFAASVRCRWITTESDIYRFHVFGGVADRAELGGFLSGVALNLDASSDRPTAVLGGFMSDDVVS